MNELTTLMLMMGMVFIALIAVLGKLSPSMMRKVTGYDVTVDVGMFFLLKGLYFGTASGMTIAFGGGLMFSLMLFAAKALLGYEKLESRRCTHCNARSLKWIRYPPRLRLGRS